MSQFLSQYVRVGRQHCTYFATLYIFWWRLRRMYYCKIVSSLHMCINSYLTKTVFFYQKQKLIKPPYLHPPSLQAEFMLLGENRVHHGVRIMYLKYNHSKTMFVLIQVVGLQLTREANFFPIWIWANLVLTVISIKGRFAFHLFNI